MSSPNRHRGDRTGGRAWPAATQLLLTLAGIFLAGATFWTVLSMPDLLYHPARNGELSVTYEKYREIGVLLVKENGTGSWYGQVPGTGLTKAAGDDDPGTYLIASLMSHLTDAPEPYKGLRWAMALLTALPMLLLPTAVARVYGRARAGMAMLALPLLTWLINRGTVLVGTEYGLFDWASPQRVYALYGMPAVVIFGALVLLTYASTKTMRLPWLLGLSVVTILIGTGANLLRSMSGVGIALALALVWWLVLRRSWHWVKAAGVAMLVAVLAVLGVMSGPRLVMAQIDKSRDQVVSAETSKLPTAHGLWHPFYLGLSYPQPLTGEASRFGVVWSDQFGWDKAHEVDPTVVVASAEYDQIMKKLYFDAIKADKDGALWLYAAKTMYTIKHFAAFFVVIGLAALLVLRRPGPQRGRVLGAAALALPTILIGLLPVVIVMPMLYYYTELIAGLGLLSALALGGLVWAFTTLPSHIRVNERRVFHERLGVGEAPTPLIDGRRVALSVVIPTRNGAEVLPRTLAAFGDELDATDEILVVVNGCTDDTETVLADIAQHWDKPARLTTLHSDPGLGNALRTGVLASTGDRVLLSADDLPFGTTDLEQFTALAPQTLLAIGSKAHPDSTVPRSPRRALQSRVFRWLRSALLHSEVGDSQGTIWVDGPWVRRFATVSRETGLMWTVELVLAAEQQGHPVREVPVTLFKDNDAAKSRFRLRDALVAVREIWQLALRKDDYTDVDWPTPGSVLAASSTG